MATTRATGREPNPVDDDFLQLLYRGGELLAAGKVIEAQDFLERAHKLQPKNEKGQNLLGLTYFKLGLFDRAAELYEMLVRDNPVDPTLRVNLGLVYLKTNALQRAVREFEVAVDLAPDHKKAHNYLGLALAQQGEYGRAREHFLQAGSDAMAEKMARAIAGEGFSRPAPVQPAKARGFAELEGAEVVREQGGVPVPEAPAPDSTEASSDVVIDVVEEAPAQQAAPVPPSPPSETPPEPVAETPPEPVAEAQPAPLAEDDWGAQFGLDESASPAEAPAPASNAAEQGAELPITVDEAPGIPVAEISETPPAPEPNIPVFSVEEVSEDGMPVLTVEPENPEDLAAIAQHEEAPAIRTQEFAVPEAPPEAAAEEAPPPLPTAGAEETPAQAAPEAAGILEAQPEEWSVAATVAPPPMPVARAEVQGPAAAGAWKGGAVPVLGQLAPTVELGGASRESPFTVGASGFSARVEGELLTRLEGLVAFTGSLSFTPEMKRFRGRTTDKAFGEGAARVVRATGRGVLFIEPAEQRTFLAVDLGDESAYFRDERVFAFEEPVMFENGRVPSDVAPDLDLVHLRGNGKVVLSLSGPLRSVRVGMEEAVTVPLEHLVGWQGNLTPRVVSLLVGPGGEVLKTAVELSGEGFALISLPVR